MGRLQNRMVPKDRDVAVHPVADLRLIIQYSVRIMNRKMDTIPMQISTLDAVSLLISQI